MSAAAVLARASRGVARNGALSGFRAQQTYSYVFFLLGWKGVASFNGTWWLTGGTMQAKNTSSICPGKILCLRQM